MSDRHRFRPEDDGEDGEAVFIYGMDEGNKRFVLTVESTVEMSEEEAIMAVLVWAKDQIDNL